MISKKRGGILLYILILWGIIIFFLSLVTVLYGSTLQNVEDIRSFWQKSLQVENIMKNVVYRYQHAYDDYNIYSAQDSFRHSLTRYSDVLTPFLFGEQNRAYWEFHKDQRELPFINPVTGELYSNVLDDITNWKISWNLKSDTSVSDVKNFNPLQRAENAHLRITLMKFGADTVIKCFNTNNDDVIADIIASDAFYSSITLKESYFRSAALSDDCTQIDPDETGELLNADGSGLIDFNNLSYVLIVEALDGATHVRVNAVGNNSFIPTNTLSVVIEPEQVGKSTEKEIFVAGRGSLVFTLLDSNDRIYQNDLIDSPEKLSQESWEYFMKKIDERY